CHLRDSAPKRVFAGDGCFYVEFESRMWCFVPSLDVDVDSGSLCASVAHYAMPHCPKSLSVGSESTPVAVCFVGDTAHMFCQLYNGMRHASMTHAGRWETATPRGIVFPTSSEGRDLHGVPCGRVVLLIGRVSSPVLLYDTVSQECDVLAPHLVDGVKDSPRTVRVLPLHTSCTQVVLLVECSDYSSISEHIVTVSLPM
ncbi:hypothetical protein KIPB_011343, partial [Kipferlia bialata]